MVEASALWIVAPGVVERRGEVLPLPGADQVLVRTLASGISRGTEALVLAGRVPAGEHQRMRAPFQAGDFTLPVKYGYQSVGVVEAGPAALRGRAVFCLHPHQDRYMVPAATVVPLPDGVPAERAVFGANAETALNVVWDAGIGPGDRIAVVGGGVLGLLVAWLVARLPGTGVTLIDIEPARARLAAALGLRFALPGGELPADCDVVVHTSASEAGLALALDLAGFEATVVEASWYGDRPVNVALGGAFHSRRLTLKSSQVGHVALAKRARVSHRQRLAMALDLLRDPALDLLISGESDFARIADDYARVLADPATLCHRIRYPA
jgi:threonine dehydrogenase-like Zn-dependent dehydrogenase